VRCTAHPQFWDFNLLRIERADDALEARALAATADELQADLLHRRLEAEGTETGARLRPGFDALGWATERLVWLALTEPAAGPEFEEVPVAETRALRLEWARSEPWVTSDAELERQAAAEEAVSRLRGTRALVARDDTGTPSGFVLFETDGECGEIDQAYVTPAARGRGTGGALVAAAARRAGTRETFIVADDEGDAKRLYLRLGFEPVWLQHQYTRRPS
jgi:GNAT superfamily N-acetyltransferase